VKRAAILVLALALSAPGTSFAQAEPMPAGHPAVGTAGTPAGPEQDAVVAAPDLPPGTIRLKLVDAQGRPLADTEARLSINFQKISEGEQRSEQRAKTDAAGLATFSGLTASSDFSYRLTTKSGPAEYASDPIQLKPDMGMLALLHVYPVTRDINEASVGSRGFVYVETRDDVFQFEVLFRVFNMGAVTWVPADALMSLPAGFKAFKPGESMSDVRFEESPGHGAKLVGTFSPGQHNVSFRFQLPRHEESSAAFRFGLPPHTAEIRFIAEAAPSMQLDIDGFEKPQTDVNQNGQRVVVTRHVSQRGQPPLKTFDVVLSGIPTPGNGRWIAAFIAASLALLGFAAFRGKLGHETQVELQERDAERAQRVLLDELVELTRAKQAERIGPSTFESARRALVEALARIVSQNPKVAKKRKARPATSPKKDAAAGRNRPSGPASTA
jgi:hypothetical protein